jgi:two-component system phosphate regulon response regulator PhoB
MAAFILVVDDEPDLRALVVHALTREGLEARGVATGAEALEVMRRETPALVILDVMLPGLSGTEVCRRLRAEPATREVPVIMLSARGEEIDRVVGFEVGADDYVTKPFSTRELLLRVRAVLRRAQDEPPDAPGAAAADASRLVIDEPGHRALVDGRDVQLTATEFRLLTTLSRRAGRVQTRAALLHDVWEVRGDVPTRTVDTHVKRLREKLGDTSECIETVRGVGYRFRRAGERA